MVTKRTWYCYIVALFITLVPMRAQAAFSLIHTASPFGMIKEGRQPDSIQAIHTETHVLYANPGDTLRLHRTDRNGLTGYVRWYCYDTDRRADRTAKAFTISVKNATFTAKTDSYKLENDYGWFKDNYAASDKKSRVTDDDKNFYEINYFMHSGDSIYRIACDQSDYTNYSPAAKNWSNNSALTEPTLSKRVIYEMHPATEIAARVASCTGDTYLETHEMIAPVNRQLYIGPDHCFYGGINAIKQYAYLARSNYYYLDGSGNAIPMNNNTNWEWSTNGKKNTLSASNMIAGQFIKTSANSAGKVTYTLRYKVGSTYYNIAKIIVDYMDPTIVGPNENIPGPTNKMELIYENRFNYSPLPTSTDVSYWSGHLNVDESTYGYYFTELSSAKSHHVTEPNWSEYGIVNRQDAYNGPDIYNHVDGKGNEIDNARDGYMIFVDAGQQPGLLFNLTVDADLCPGSTMYFSAWVCDASSQNNCAPNLDFIVLGIDTDGNEYPLTTYTTGEFGINAVDKVGANGKMKWCTWFQVMFPVKFDAEDIYASYRLKIMNKGKHSDGNDFAIDDIRIYTQKPPVIPIQASTYDCPGETTDSITAYLRIDYQAIELNGDPRLYYQWRNSEDEIVRGAYSNADSASTVFGAINLLMSEEDILASGDTCSSLLSFDSQYFDTRVPLYKYIKERVDATTERFILYIAQPMAVRTNYVYTGFVARQSHELGQREGCGTFADLLIAGGTRIEVDGQAMGDSIVSLCGHRSYKMNIVLTYIQQNKQTQELEEKSTPCRADWLIGDSIMVNEHPAIYKYTFDNIREAIYDYRYPSHSALTDSVINHLRRSGLLVLDTAATTMQPAVSLSYTAFPVAGSAANNMAVCLAPRFMHIIPSAETLNRMVVGNRNDQLPEAVAAVPRKVRISNEQKRTGEFYVETYLVGEDRDYVIDKVLLIGSTFPEWEAIELDALTIRGGKEIEEEDSLLIYGEALKALTPGYDYTFHIRCVDEEKGCERGYTYFTLRIVPDEVTWYGGRWNDDDCWDSFIPMPETNVILSQGTDYSIRFTEDSIYDYNYRRNECHHIYIPHDASLAGQEEIRIHGKAFIDILAYANKWTLTSIPIKGVVTGDLFSSQAESSQPFTVAPIRQEEGNVAEDRVVYMVYNSEYDATKRKWKTATISTTTAFAPGEARMIGIDCMDGAADPVIRLPKVDNQYHYYNESDELWRAEYETVERDPEYGKPLYNGETVITLKEIYRDVYLLGNPTFGYLNIDEVVELNSDILTGRYYLEPRGVEQRPREVENFPGDINEEEEDVLLPPFRGMLLEGRGIGSDQLVLRVIPEMVNKRGRVAARRPVYRGIATGIDSLDADCDTIETPSRIYDLAGNHIANQLTNIPDGIYIVQQGSGFRKVVIRR